MWKTGTRLMLERELAFVVLFLVFPLLGSFNVALCFGFLGAPLDANVRHVVAFCLLPLGALLFWALGNFRKQQLAVEMEILESAGCYGCEFTGAIFEFVAVSAKGDVRLYVALDSSSVSPRPEKLPKLPARALVYPTSEGNGRTHGQIMCWV